MWCHCDAMSYEVPRLSRKIIFQKLKMWCSKMQPLSGNQRPDLLTALMNMSLVLRLPCEMHLAISSSHEWVDVKRCLPPAFPHQVKNGGRTFGDRIWFGEGAQLFAPVLFPLLVEGSGLLFGVRCCIACLLVKIIPFGFFISILMHESQGSRLSPMLRIMHLHGNTRLQRVRASGWWWNSGRTLIHAV